MRESQTQSLHLLLAAPLVLAWLAPFAGASPGHWGIDVTLTPAQTKAGQSVDFTVTLANSGDLTVTVCQLDIQFVWDTDVHNVFAGSQNIPSHGNWSWTTREGIPPSLAPQDYAATINVTAMTLIEPLCTSNNWIVPVRIIPNILPTAAFSFAPSNPSPDAIVYFTDMSTDPDGVVASWHWDFGDGSNSTTQDPVHAFAKAGSYDVILVVRDNDDGSSAVSHPVAVLSNLPPLAGFSYAYPAADPDMSIQFSDGSSDPDGTIVQWHWEFGDGTTSTERNPAHHFPEARVYQVVLTVTDNDGASNSVTQAVFVASNSSLPNEPTPSGIGVLELGLLGAVVASAAGVGAVLIRRKIHPARRWGQANNSSPPEDSKRRWRPR